MKLQNLSDIQTKAFFIVLNDERIEAHGPQTNQKLNNLCKDLKKHLKGEGDISLSNPQQEFAERFLDSKLNELDSSREAYELLQGVREQLPEGQP